VVSTHKTTQCHDQEGTYWHLALKLMVIIKVCCYNTGKSLDYGRLPIATSDAIKLIITLTLQLWSLDVIRPDYFDNHFDI
jgi:hypothetical protein